MRPIGIYKFSNMNAGMHHGAIKDWSLEYGLVRIYLLRNGEWIGEHIIVYKRFRCIINEDI